MVMHSGIIRFRFYHSDFSLQYNPPDRPNQQESAKEPVRNRELAVVHGDVAAAILGDIDEMEAEAMEERFAADAAAGGEADGPPGPFGLVGNALPVGRIDIGKM